MSIDPILYRSETSLQTTVMPEDTDPGLHEQFTFEQIEELHEIFKNEPDQRLNYEEFRRLLSRYHIDLSDNDYNILFAKINFDRDMQHVGWDEFISYLILGYERNDPSNREETLLDPIESWPVLKKSGHRHPVVCMDRVVCLMPDRSVKQGTGGYCTASREGLINFWSNELKILKTGYAKNPYFKTIQTWILSVVYMPDVRIMCTSATERDLRFYDLSASNFYLRIVINSLPYPIYCTHYYFPKSMDQTCKLILGDSSGNVRLLEFSPERRGPFESKLRSAVIEVSWADVIKGRLSQVKVQEYLNLHNDIVRQVDYSEHLNSIFSIAECYESNNCAAMVATDLGVTKFFLKFYAPKGFSTFSLDDEHHLIVTGGPDCLVRIWNPFVPQKPIGILSGHCAGIVYVFIQRDENKVYSIDHLKVIKIWALTKQTLLQTYMGLQQLIPRGMPFVCCYNPDTHDLLIGSTKLVLLKCSPRIPLDLIDGETHAGSVSVVLYNTLFRTVVSCGLDGFIIFWDPRTGKRLRLIKEAHMRIVDGKGRHVEISSACFDPYQQFLLTGARDGSLKIWNFNSGDCVRNLHIGAKSELRALFWIPDRILVIGWNRHVTEFSDVEGEEYSDGQNWEILHNADIMSAAIREPDCLVTGCYSGTLILWKLETGQPYRQYNIQYPQEFIKIKRSQNATETLKDVSMSMQHGSGTLQKRSTLSMPIKTMIFLKTRPCSKEHGTLLVALENGNIQVYSHHNLGGFMQQFSAIHMPGDSVVTMATDERNRYLFTATARGYIKTWLMTNFCMPENEHTKLSMPKLRLRFLFLLEDRFPGRAKRCTSGNLPTLLNSFRAHLQPISTLQYLDRSHILISGSSDKTTRLWTLGGRYLGTFGTPLPWHKLTLNDPVRETGYYRMPPDIFKWASSTTLKVLSGADPEPVGRPKLKTRKEQDETSVNITLQAQVAEIETKGIYGKPLTEPILGKNFKMPIHVRPRLKPIFDKTLPYIPVYTHLDIHAAQPIERPPTPEALKRLREVDLMNDEWNGV